MKKMFLLSNLLLAACTTLCQQPGINRIDSLATAIDQAAWLEMRDTINNGMAEAGVSSQTVVTMITDGKQLLKYINQTNIGRRQADSMVHTEYISLFYFHDKKLSLAVDSVNTGRGPLVTRYYFESDQCIYPAKTDGRTQKRINTLLETAKGMQEAIIPRLGNPATGTRND